MLHIVRSHSCCGVALIRRKHGTGQDAIGGADTEQAQHQTLRLLQGRRGLNGSLRSVLVAEWQSPKIRSLHIQLLLQVARDTPAQIVAFDYRVLRI